MELGHSQAKLASPSPEVRNLHADERLVSADPWADMDAEQERRDNWMLSYIDILTLILTLFVLLLVLQPKHETPSAQQIPELAELLSLTLAEHYVVDTFEDDTMEPMGIATLIGTPFPDADPTLFAEAETDQVVSDDGIAIVEEKAGILASAIAEPVVQSKQPMQSGSEKTTIDPNARPAAATVKKLDRPRKYVSTMLADGPQASAAEIVLAELKSRWFVDHLKTSRVAAGLQLEVSDKILFAEGSAELKIEGRNLLSELAQVLLKHQGLISVEGHTDNRPISSSQFPSNWELSSGRATTVTRYLISHGLDPTKLRSVGYADTRPLDTNATTEGRKRNRRVSLVLEPAQHQQEI